MDDSGPRKSLTGRRLLIVLAVLLITAAVPRLWRLGYRSLWLDEIVTKKVAERGPAFAVEFAARDVTPPFHYLVAAAADRLGASDVWVRVPPAVLGTLSVPLLFLVALRCGLSPGGAGVAALLLLLSPFHIQFSQDARMYSYVVFLTVLATAALATVVSPDEKTPGRRALFAWGAGFAVCSLFNVYTSYFSFLLVASQCFLLLVAGGFWLMRAREGRGKRSLRLLVVTAVVVTIGFLPWLPALGSLAEREAGESARSFADSLAVLKAVFSDFGGRNGPISVALGILAAAGLWRLRKTWVGFYSVILFVLPLVALLGFQTKHFVSSRYFSYLLPQYYLLAGCGLAGFAGTLGRILEARSVDSAVGSKIRTGILVVLTAVILAGFLPQLSLYYVSQIQNWREAADIVLREAKTGDVILCGVNMTEEALGYYIARRKDAPRVYLYGGCRNPVCFREAFAGRYRGWAVTSHAGFFRKSYPKLWAEIEDRMELYARLPAMEEWGEIWIFRMKGQGD
jgi:hypothetical protein